MSQHRQPDDKKEAPKAEQPQNAQQVTLDTIGQMMQQLFERIAEAGESQA